MDPGASWELAVVNLHLDDRKEEVRMRQMKMVMNWLEKDCPSAPHILCGDFNALSTWSEEVQARRLRHGLEPAREEVYRWLVEEQGYTDLEDRQPPRATSDKGQTRVDYILLSPSLLPRVRVEHSKLTIIDTESDHSALLGDLQFDRNKLLLGIETGGRDGQGSLAAGLKARMTEQGLGGSISTLTDSSEDMLGSLTRRDTVIVEGPTVRTLLPSLDLLFNATETPTHGHTTEGGKVLAITDVGAMVDHLELYLAKQSS